MQLALVRSWATLSKFLNTDLNSEFQNIRNWWNDHDAGVRTWNNVNATNSTITTSTITSETFTTLTSSTANPASAGSIRLANVDSVLWRNAANSGNDSLGVNGGDQLVYNATTSGMIANSFSYINPATAIATTGVLRMANSTDFLAWRNNANSGDLALKTDTSDRLLYNGNIFFTSAGQLLGKGTATNDNATAGNIGEYISSSVASGAPVTLVTATPKNITSISVTAGDWDIGGLIGYIFNAANCTSLLQSSSLTTNTNGGEASLTAAQFTMTTDQRWPIATARYSFASTTTVYLVASATFTGTGITGFGTIYARRAR